MKPFKRKNEFASLRGAIPISPLGSKPFVASCYLKGITGKQVSSQGRTLYESPVSQSRDQLPVDGSLTAASEELSAVPSRAIVHRITTECQELLDLVLELDFPYDAHPIFSTTDSDEEAR